MKDSVSTALMPGTQRITLGHQRIALRRAMLLASINAASGEGLDGG